MVLGNIVRPVNSMSMGPLPHCYCCKVSSLIKVNSLIRSNDVCNNITVIKAFCKSMGGGFSRAFGAGKANLYSGEVYAKKHEVLLLL